MPNDQTDDPTAAQVLDTVDRFVRERLEPRAAGIDATDEFPRDLYREAADLGLLALAIPEAYGGVAVSLRTRFTVIERLTRSSASFGLIVASCPDSALPIDLGGCDEIKREVLPRLASGEWIPAFALSEPGAGSDAAAITTTARRDGDDYVIDGVKAWCTQGSIADVITVFAKTDPDAGHKGISAFRVRRGTPGFAVVRDEELTGLRGAPQSQLRFEGARVPASARLGEEGDGFRFAMLALDEARLNASAQGLGVAHRCLTESIAYARERRAFGKPIIEHQGIQFLLAGLATEYGAARALWLEAIAELARGRSRKASAFASMAKNACTDLGMKAPIEAMQVFGAAGLSRGLPLERMMRDAKAFQIFDGPTQIHNMIIGRHLAREGLPWE